MASIRNMAKKMFGKWTRARRFARSKKDDPPEAVEADALDIPQLLEGDDLLRRRRHRLRVMAEILCKPETRTAVELFDRMLGGMPDRVLAAYLLPHLKDKILASASAKNSSGWSSKAAAYFWGGAPIGKNISFTAPFSPICRRGGR